MALAAKTTPPSCTRAAADEFANLGRVGVVEVWRRKRIGFEPGDQIAVGQDVGRAGGPSPCLIDGDVVERLEHGSNRRVEQSRVQDPRFATASRSPSAVAAKAVGSTAHRPTSGARVCR